MRRLTKKISTDELRKILMSVYNTLPTDTDNIQAKNILIYSYNLLKKNIRMKDTPISQNNLDLMVYTMHLPKAYHFMKVGEYVNACDEIALALDNFANHDMISLRDRNLILLTIEEGLGDEILSKKKRRNFTMLHKIRLYKSAFKRFLSARRG